MIGAVLTGQRKRNYFLAIFTVLQKRRIIIYYYYLWLIQYLTGYISYVSRGV